MKFKYGAITWERGVAGGWEVEETAFFKTKEEAKQYKKMCERFASKDIHFEFFKMTEWPK